MANPIRVLELRSVRGTGGGPEKTIMLGAAESNPDDFAITVCYIRDGRDRVFRLDERARALGIDYVEVHERHSADLAIWPRLRKLVREKQIDIVHAHEYKTDLLALLLAQVERVVPLSTVHGWSGHSRRELKLYYPCDRWLLSRYPRLIAVSTEIKNQLVAGGARPDRISVVLNAIDPAAYRREPGREASARARWGFGPEHFVVGTVGRLEIEKRFDLLIEAVAQLHKTFPDVRLVIAGDGGQKASLVDTASRLLPPGVCHFPGHIADVAELYHAFNLFALSSDHEGTPNAVLEAMAFETPIVATNVGGVAELAPDSSHALLVPPGQPRALASAIERVRTDPASAEQRVRAARHRVEAELSFAARMRAVERIYRDLTSDQAGGVRRSGFLQWV